MQYVVRLALLMMCGVLGACAGSVKVVRTKPAQFPVAEVQSLAVIPLRSGAQVERRAAERVARRLARRVRDRQFFSRVHVIDDARLRYPSPASLSEEAKQIGADAAVSIDMQHYGVDTAIRSEWVSQRRRTGRRVREAYLDKGVQKHRMVDEYEMHKAEELHVEKRARVRFLADYVRVDAPDSHRQQQYADARAEAAQGAEAIDDLPEDRDMLRRLSRGLVWQLANALVPHEVVERRRLAKDKECKAGNKLARKGEWSRALEAWALVATPCATYNSGVAYEALQRFGKAHDAYARAVDLEARPLFREALERIVMISEEQQRLQMQKSGR